jgi:hypothetical protein
MAKSNRQRKLDHAKAEHKRAEITRRRAGAEIESEARRKTDALFRRGVDLRVGPAELAKLLLVEPDNTERVLVREDARPASLPDRVRMALDSFPEGPPPSALIFAAVAARVMGDDREERRHLDALREFLRGPVGREWQERLGEGFRVAQGELIETIGYPDGQKSTYIIYLNVVANARRRAIDAALAAEENVEGLSAAEFLSLLRQYASRPSGLDQRAKAKVRARLAAPISDFLFDQAVNAAFSSFAGSIIDSLIERFADTPDGASR